MPPEALRKIELAAPCGVLLIGLALGGAATAYRGWVALNDREPLLAGLPAGGAQQSGPGPTRLVRHLVMVIADGVNAEELPRLAALTRVRALGIQARAVAAGPTFSWPSYATWLSGVDPVDSGVRTNRHHGSLRLDSALSRARAAGLRTLGYDEGPLAPLGDLFGPQLTRRLRGSEAWNAALVDVAQVDLAVLSLTAVDRAAHREGRHGPSTREALAELDRRLLELLAHLDLRRDLLVVVNDHGHLEGGGHGGTESEIRELFLVAAGAGIGRCAEARQIDQKDLAPTLTALLGIHPPSHNRGWSMGWALSSGTEERIRAAALVSQYRTRWRVERYLARELGVALPGGPAYPRPDELASLAGSNIGEARRVGWRTLAAMQGRIEAARAGQLMELRRGRLLWAGGLALGILAAIGLGARLGAWRIGGSDLMLALLLVGMTAGGLYLLGIRPSLSQSHGRTAVGARVAVAAAQAALAQGILAWVLARRRAARGTPGGPVGGILVGGWASGGLAGICAALAPVVAGAALPDLRWVAAAVLALACFAVHGAVGGGVLLVWRLTRSRGSAGRS